MMTKHKLKWMAVGVATGACVIALLAAVPSQTDFDPAYFRTNALPITLVGSVTNIIWDNAGNHLQLWGGGSNIVEMIYPRRMLNAGNGNISSTNIHFKTADSEVLMIGSLIGASSTLTNINSLVAIGSGPIANSTIENLGSVYLLGDSALADSGVTNLSNSELIGPNVADGASILNGTEIDVLGYNAFQNTIVADSSQIYGLGSLAIGNSVVVNHSFDLVGIGDGALSGSTFDNVGWVIGLGSFSMSGVKLTNSAGIISIGHDSLIKNNGTLNNVVLIGDNLTVTNSNDFLLGNTSANYFFPGASAQFDNSINISKNITAGQYQLNQDTLTHAGTVTLDLSSANAHSLSITGDVTFAFSNLATNRTFQLLIIGTSTNANITWPANTHGPLPVLAFASKWIRCSGEAWGTDAAHVWVSAASDP